MFLNNVEFNEENLESKIRDFREAYRKSQQNIVVIADFDYTITCKFNYSSPHSPQYNTCYQLFENYGLGHNPNIIKEADDLARRFIKYENDPKIPYAEREKQLRRWYNESIELHAMQGFTFDEVERKFNEVKDVFMLRRGVKEFFELLMRCGIKIIIISAGFIEAIKLTLKSLFPNINDLLDKNKIIIISNSFTYDPVTNVSNGFDKNIIFTMNKAHFIKKTVDKLGLNVKKAFVLGDNLADFNSVDELNLSRNDIIGLGFVNLKPTELTEEFNEKNSRTIKEYKQVFDVILKNDSGYDFLIHLLNKMRI